MVTNVLFQNLDRVCRFIHLKHLSRDHILTLSWHLAGRRVLMMEGKSISVIIVVLLVFAVFLHFAIRIEFECRGSRFEVRLDAT